VNSGFTLLLQGVGALFLYRSVCLGRDIRTSLREFQRNWKAGHLFPGIPSFEAYRGSILFTSYPCDSRALTDFFVLAILFTILLEKVTQKTKRAYVPPRQMPMQLFGTLLGRNRRLTGKVSMAETTAIFHSRSC
jgi:hypothetical protein